MAQKTLSAVVVLGGKVDGTFGQIGNKLMEMGTLIDDVSQKLINFGKDSVDVYRGYEDSMLDAQVALATTYGRGTKELKDVMNQLDIQATQWAASTIFHTDDVANAIAQAAHANWDLEKIMDGIPAAMELAQAGGLELSESVDYIIKSTNAAGISFGDLTDFIDEWTFAANSSAGDVRQFGDAMTRMGSTMKFAKNKEELLTMLAILHDAGTTGSDAGTLLRNGLIRLIAPTKKASDVMAELGVTSDDIEEAMGETNGKAAETVKQLESMGFSAYDSQGNLKGFLDIFQDLYDVTKGMADDEKYDIWSTIFPTRTITGAMALMDACKGDLTELYKLLMDGEAAGYGKYASETMMSGMTGAIETLNSKLEALKQLTGQQLSDQVETIAGNIGKVFDLLSSGGGDNGVSSGLDLLTRISQVIGDAAEGMGKMDPAAFDALVAGLGAIAVAGPGLIGAGMGFKLVGAALGTHTGRIALAAIAFTALAEAANKFKEAKFKEGFGDMEIDTTELKAKLEEIQTSFTEATTGITEFQTALETATTNYETAAQKFSATALSDMLTGKTLTPEDIKAYNSLGEQAVQAVKDGITAKGDMDAEFWYALFKGTGATEKTAEEVNADPIYAGILKTIQEAQTENLAEVEAAGQALRDAMTAAFKDGTISPEEYDNIKNIYRDLNEKIAQAQAEAQSEQDYINRRKLMDKAQNMSYSSMMAFLGDELIPQRDAELAFWEDHYGNAVYGLEYQKEQKMAKAKNAAERAEIENEYDQKIRGSQAALQNMEAGINSNYDQMILGLMNTAQHESDYGDADRFWEGLVRDVSEGKLTESAARMLLQQSGYTKMQGGILGIGGSSELGDAYKFRLEQIEALGGWESISKRIDSYKRAGDEEAAQSLQTILDMVKLYESPAGYKSQSWVPEGATANELWDMVSHISELGDSDMLNFWNAIGQGNENTFDLMGKMSSEELEVVNQIVDQLDGIYDFQKVNAGDESKFAQAGNLFENIFAAWKLMNMGDSDREKYKKGSTEKSEIEDLVAEIEIEKAEDTTNETYETMQGILDEAEALEAEIEVKEPEQAAVEGYDAMQQTLDGKDPVSEEIEISNGVDAAVAAYSEMQEYANGHPVTFTVQTTGGISGGGGGVVGKIGSAIGNFFGGLFTKKAEGGRETKPAIFAEAGIPEWYIPEEHTDNTLGLILAAAYNSGFDILDLAEEAGARMFAEGGTDGGGSLNWGSMISTRAAASSGSSAISAKNSSGNTFSVQYSPVIHADDARGVGDKLEEDKKRFEKWIEEWWEKKSLYESMVAYT
ncbi:MAG: phage tail tape measure protein [Clostridia bacterium]|nr:phage tail tape measure protein [Clostridia bacterium]